MSTEISASEGGFVVQLEHLMGAWGSTGKPAEEGVPKQ